MNKILLTSIFASFMLICLGKDTAEYLDSFPLIEARVLETVQMHNIAFQMSKNEAISYVYDGDSTKIKCIAEEFDMLTENVTSYYEVEYLPKKIGRLNFENYYCILYTIIQCETKDNDYSNEIHMSFYNYDNNLIERYLVHKNNEYEPQVESIINVRSNSIFRFQFLDNEQSLFELFQIQDTKPYLKLLESSNKDIYSGDLNESLKKLGWYKMFYHDN